MDLLPFKSNLEWCGAHHTVTTSRFLQSDSNFTVIKAQSFSGKSALQLNGKQNVTFQDSAAVCKPLKGGQVCRKIKAGVVELGQFPN